MDEPLLSGSGEVKTNDCSDQVLTDWSEVLDKWRSDFSSRPNGLKQLVRKSIPNALRGEVWQLLAGCHDNNHVLEQYRILISKVLFSGTIPGCEGVELYVSYIYS